MRVKTFFLQFNGCGKDGASLHLGDFRIGVAKTAATVTKHRVVFAEAFHTLADIFYCHAHCFCHFFLSLCIVGNEFVERGIEKTNVHGITVHGAEDALEVFFLIGQQFG